MFFHLFLACGTETAPPTPAVDPRDQYTLLREIVSAEKEKDIVAYRAVRDGWEGHRYRWEVLSPPELCFVAGCNVLPFDNARYDGTIFQGWLPRLKLDEAGRAARDAACAGHDPCVLTFEGRLSSFRFNPAELTELTFDDIAIVGARPRRGDEAWGQRHLAGRGDLEGLKRRGEELRARGFRPTLAVQDDQ